jgi:hypothetical protein
MEKRFLQNTPSKIKIYMWFIHGKEILTKDNLVKRNWQGNSECYFYDQQEGIQHLFIKCPFAKITWKIIHMAFNITTPLENGSVGCLKLRKLISELIFVRYYGPFGMCAIILYLTNQVFCHSCRLSLCYPT